MLKNIKLVLQQHDLHKKAGRAVSKLGQLQPHSLCRCKMAFYLNFKISRLLIWITEVIVEAYVG